VRRNDSRNGQRLSCCGAQNLLLAFARQILTAAAPYCSLYPPLAALANVPCGAFFGTFLGETRKVRPTQWSKPKHSMQHRFANKSSYNLKKQTDRQIGI